MHACYMGLTSGMIYDQLCSQDILEKPRDFLAKLYDRKNASNHAQFLNSKINLQLLRATYDVLDDDVNGNLCGTSLVLIRGTEQCVSTTAKYK